MIRSGFLFRLRQILLLALVLGGFITLIKAAYVWEAWNTKGNLEPSGGCYFVRRVEIAGPLFRQGDERWRKDLLGPTSNTLGAEGCAVSSAAMVLASYGIDTDPQRLNAFLKTNDGFTPQGWIYWEKAAELAPERVRHVYENLPTYHLLDANLCAGNPVIIRIRRSHGGTHFVVIAGKDGFDYLTRDPAASPAKGLYPLREVGSKIEALRFYEKR
jgi:hypothetical protein